ncbi:A disintegrin and metalloproteinase with thrombospondin motifs 10 isoform X4 [Rhinopithecus roxellana]|uniref:A disintegrin and metalloproteinase with thrombospondin motifs 10 isoform X4 n=1 Tax=Rhinopithecus roxellana TaxID=61622 RepID=UPI0012374D07|nr:A disintegrin and metalloproteinase with thrombospondin motifs 10 isoform X4 [Rhinopithecus roxellana]
MGPASVLRAGLTPSCLPQPSGATNGSVSPSGRARKAWTEPGGRGLLGATAAGHVAAACPLPAVTATAPGQPSGASIVWVREGGTAPATRMTAPLAPRTSEKCSVLNSTASLSVGNSTHGKRTGEACSLTCLAEGFNFYTERAAAVVDGTPCRPDTVDICVSGECKHVGCDRVLGSDVREDKCRVCGGDGSACETIEGVFSPASPGAGYEDVVWIPKGSVHIFIQDLNLSLSHLALKGDQESLLLEGLPGTPQPHRLSLAGTTFQLRQGPDQFQSLEALGPINASLIVMVLARTELPALRYRFNAPIARDSLPPYSWHYAPWTKCSAQCAGGSQVQAVECRNQLDSSAVAPHYCSAHSKLPKRQRACNTEPCPPDWVVGNWSRCSRSCDAGVRSRSVVCQRRVSAAEEKALDDSACPQPRPPVLEACHGPTCPPEWAALEWSECTPSCGPGLRHRVVLCKSADHRATLPPAHCSPAAKPPATMRCNLRRCPPARWVAGEWGECSAQCGVGQQQRSVRCTSHTGQASHECTEALRPPTTQQCEAKCDSPTPGDGPEECKDVNKVAYCPLVLKFQFCSRAYFRQMCCKTCQGH